ncbi:hypothetical protein BpHYR1_024945 [Brachionus plicatilis]|uniref:Uncharacterized protein n=1 Tax=Brachionus plicatilis TaxID=10195 RepID=A0A3M7PEV6_BRAPC|nr:hypothetical protein BpHYR1_024945 [Brachionus plicatilis]
MQLFHKDKVNTRCHIYTNFGGENSRILIKTKQFTFLRPYKISMKVILIFNAEKNYAQKKKKLDLSGQTPKKDYSHPSIIRTLNISEIFFGIAKFRICGNPNNGKNIQASLFFVQLTKSQFISQLHKMNSSSQFQLNISSKFSSD